MKVFASMMIVFSLFALTLSDSVNQVTPVIDEKKSDVVFENGKLTVELALFKKGLLSVRGKICVEVIDPKDQVILKKTRELDLIGRFFKPRFTFNTKLDRETLLTYRLRITNTIKGKSTTHLAAISNLMDQIQLSVLGQNQLYGGSQASMRIMVENFRNKEPMDGAHIEIRLKDKDSKKLFSGKTDSNGTLDFSLSIPEELEEDGAIEIVASDKIGRDTLMYPVTFKKGYQIYLVMDKPVYQPGQIIHMRSLTLQKPSMKSASGMTMVCTIEDPKGNKVFKKKLKTDSFGVAACDFTLADEINLGEYRIRSELEDTEVEKSVNVKRYVLPKFKISLNTNQDYYRPGETLIGDIEAAYFFGKAVDGAEIKIVLSKFDIGFQTFQEIQGKTDQKGKYHFETRLPDYFIGQPLEQGDAFIKIDVEVIDKAEHMEKLVDQRIITKNDLNVVLIPESGQLVPNLENILYAVTTHPDGKPVSAQVTLFCDGGSIKGQTDESGIGDFRVVPQNPEGFHIRAEAKDEKGNSGESDITFSYDLTKSHILLRTDKGLYRGGESLKMSILSSKKRGVVYVDLIKDQQTVLTRTVPIENGKGKLEIPLTPDLSGSLWIHGYTVAGGEEIMRDTKVVYVNPANDLSLSIHPDKTIYKPGEEGQIDFSVKDIKGQGILAILGIAIVDEAVFGLTEMQPGLEKVYFTLEKELMEPKYEIHGLTPRQIVFSDDDHVAIRRKERAAGVLFASFSELEPFSLKKRNTEDLGRKLSGAYIPGIFGDYRKIVNAVQKYYRKEKKYPSKKEGFSVLIEKNYLVYKDILDPWGNPYEAVSQGEDLSWFGLLSYGPDHEKGSDDDINTLSEHDPILKSKQVRMFDGLMEEGQFLGRSAIREDIAAPHALEINGLLGAGPEMVGDKKGTKAPRIREYFPETFIFEPALITDQKGRGVLPLKWPDSITEWRVTATASTAMGRLGSTTHGIKVFQDFFVDIDLPVSLTQNDIVSVPVALYNYIKDSQSITLTLQEEEWYELLDQEEKLVTLEENEVSVVYFKLRAKKIGRHTFTVKAIGDKMSDAIRRKIEIMPDGQKFESILSNQLQDSISGSVIIPKEAISGSGKIFVRLFPGMVSQVVEGMESMLGMPFGCFEQTSSVTYPNVLILDYLRGIRKITPEIEMRAEQYINVGYQRLLSYEVAGGGFEWFGNEPANRMLTAYGLMEFFDMHKVFEVDPNLIFRTQTWLVGQQNKDGSWSPDEGYLHQESWSRIQKNRTLPTAYILWSLAETDYPGEALEKGLAYIEKNVEEENDSYVLAICANALVAFKPESPITENIIKRLIGMKTEDKDNVYWQSDLPTFTFAKGKGADIETTALATYALIRYNRYPNIINKAIHYLVQSKSPSGNWGTTQATVLSLKCLLASLKGSAEKVNGRIDVAINGNVEKTIQLNRDNSDVMFLVDLSNQMVQGENSVSVSIEGEGNPMVEIVSRYFMPWFLVKPVDKKEILSIDLRYDVTTLSQDDLATCFVVVKNNIPATADMVIVDLGIPPGFSVETADLQKWVGTKIQKYQLTARQVILYVKRIDPEKPLELSYRIRAKFPVKAKTPLSRAYKYYEPDVESFSKPVDIEVKG